MIVLSQILEDNTVIIYYINAILSYIFSDIINTKYFIGEVNSMYFIIIAGMPCSGKSTFADYLSKKSKLPYMSKDLIKEKLYDTVGFKCREEKNNLGKGAMNILYYFAEEEMKTNSPFIIENNFENISKPELVALIKKYNYYPITIMFGGDDAIIYERFIKRDQMPGRHRGHVVNTQYPEVAPAPEYIPMGLETFKDKIKKRGWKTFDVGGTKIVIDNTDFSKIDYEEIIERINAAAKGHK